MVIVKAKFPQHWRNNRYDKDQVMPATEKQGERLTKAGVTYYDLAEAVEFPDESWKVDGIKDYLTENDIEFESTLRKAELLELC